MKKIFLLLLILLPINLFAEDISDSCAYNERLGLRTVAAHVKYNLEYSKESDTFTIVIYNLIDDILISYNGVDLKTNSDGKVILGSLEPGSRFSANIVGSFTSSCAGLSLSTISVRIPYLNTYYGSSKCKGHEDLTVCKSQFLYYELTDKLFERNIQLSQEGSKQQETTDEVKTSFFSEVIKFFKNHGIQIGLVLVSVIPTIIIGNSMLRKARHGI